MSALLAWLALALADGRAAPELEQRLAQLESVDAERWNEAWQALTAIGAPAALEALAGLERTDVQGARSRARLIAEVGDAGAIEGVLARLEHPDPAVRRDLARFLGRFALGTERGPERVQALSTLARTDADPLVRREALRALPRSGLPGAAEALDELIDRVALGERRLAVESLVACPLARTRIVRRGQQTFEGPLAGQLDAPSLALFLRAYGPALADVARGGESAAERRPLVLGRKHPDERVQRACALALDAALERLIELGEKERADRLLAALGEDGLGAREVLYRRAALALAVRAGAAPEALEQAADFARRLARASGGAQAAERTWRFYAEQLGAVAALAEGRAEEAYRGFGRAEATLRGLLSERDDLRPRILTRADYPIAPTGAAVMVDRLQQVAVLQLWQALALFEGNAAAGREPVDETALEHLRQAHRLVLEAQLLALEKDADFPVSYALDDLFERELAPRRLVLGNRELEWRAGTGVDLQLLLARAFACVAPDELPGFEPAVAVDGPLSDPFLDDQRFALLQRIQLADLEAARRTWFYERARLFERAREENDPELVGRQQLLAHPVRLRLLDAERRTRALAERLRDLERQARTEVQERSRLYAELAEFRPPSELALTLAVELRTDGRAREARLLSERMLDAVRGGLAGASSISTEILSARIELSISSSYTDESRPQEAEREALAAVKRLEAFENTIETRIAEERDPGTRLRLERSLRQVQRMRSSALLSLAVNANVRLGDQPRALRYFEEAYALDQRDFMRVLLACYRARSGKAEEARAVLRTIQPAPPLYYNLACTHALLGDAETALDFLRRELDENHPAQGSRERQKGWAREDPDLASLREDPRFRRLVGS